MNNKKKIMRKPEIRFVELSCEDVISTSIEPVSAKKRSLSEDLQNYAVGGFFNSQDWYKNGHQN